MKERLYDTFEPLKIIVISLILTIIVCMISATIVLSVINKTIINEMTDTYVTENIEGSDKAEKKEIKIIYTTESDQSLSEDTSEVVIQSVEAVTDNQLYTLTDNEEYLLAKIAQCEAGNCSIETRVKIMQCIYNRVLDNKFPDTIIKVIYENHNGTYQFSPVASGGSWYYKEPKEDDYKALEIFKNKITDDSEGILYFEDCPNADNWHSRNLTYVNTYDGIRFYK